MPTNTYAPDSGLGEVAAKVGALVGAARGNTGAMLDSLSAPAKDAVKEAVANASKLLPARMARLLDKIDGDANRAFAVTSLLDGITSFERKCGFSPSADMLDAVISQAENLADGKSDKVLPHGTTLDSISTNNASATLSHQPNRIAVAITGGLSEAIPFGAYLPSDLSSNESKLAIITSIAGSDFGAYKAGEIIDGTSGGREYTRSERVVDVVVDAARTGGTFAITSQIAGGSTVPLLRGRTTVSVNGFPVAFEQSNNSGTPVSLISGQFTQGGKSYVINGSVNVMTGAGDLTFSQALAADIDVEVQGFIDFEAKPELAPHIGTIAQSFSLYCAPSRLIMQATPDSRSQSQSELGADRLTIAVQAARTQLANERYIAALRKVRKLAKNTSRTYDFNAAEQLQLKTRSDALRDLGSFIAAVDQDVANQTMEFGLSFMYVGAIGMSQFLAMESGADFVPSGLPSKPGIWRVGRYKNKYDVYYSPYVVEETDTDIEILCIGRSPQVARNPIVFSDAVSPTLIPLAVNSDLKTGAALFSRQLTEVNPHKQSALGCALITVKNVYALG